MNVRSDLVGALILGGYFASIFVAAELWRISSRPRPEWTRKLIHVGGGIGCLFFPFLVRSPWIVLVMSGCLSAIIAFAHRIGFLKSLHGVERSSRGAEYYPLAVFLVFVFTRDREWLYLSAVLVLAVGDAFAALIGGRYGSIHYEVEEERKSLEGSLVFLVIAFLAIHLPVLLLTDTPRPDTVLAALLVAVLVTGFEAISLRGTDNLWIPLGVVYVLSRVVERSLPEIVFQSVSLVVICAGIGLTVWRLPFFNVGASIVYMLYTYGTWSLGGWQWAVPAFTGLAFFLITWHSLTVPRASTRIRVRGAARAVIPLFLIVLLADTFDWYAQLYGPYLVATSMVLALSLTRHTFHRQVHGFWLRTAAMAMTNALACAVIVLPSLVVQRGVPVIAPLSVFAIVLPAAYLNALFEERFVRPAMPGWTAYRVWLTLAAAAFVLLLQWNGIIPSWRPM